MQELVLIYHSGTGGTAQMVQACMQGAQAHSNAAALRVRALPAAQAQAADLLAAHAYVLACPEHLASMSGVMKDFFDRCYYPLLDQLQGRPYACMVCAGSDGHNAAREIARIATGWRLRPIAPATIVCSHAQTPAAIAAPKQLSASQLQPCHALGAALASGLELGIF